MEGWRPVCVALWSKTWRYTLLSPLAAILDRPILLGSCMLQFLTGPSCLGSCMHSPCVVSLPLSLSLSLSLFSGCCVRIGAGPLRIGTRGSFLTPQNGKDAYFCSVLDHVGSIPGRPPQQSQEKSLKPPNSRCPGRVGTRHVSKRKTHQDQILLFFSCPVRVGTVSYSNGTVFGEL